ncbi:hypothetical protein [Escherichia phage AV108]|nr:hypothetical protein [Escherichia phage AV108]
MTLKNMFFNFVGASILSMLYLVIVWMGDYELTNDENLTVFTVLTMIIYTVFLVLDFIVFLYKNGDLMTIRKNDIGFVAGIASVFTVFILLMLLPGVFSDQIELYVAFICCIYTWFAMFVISLIMQFVVNKF